MSLTNASWKRTALWCLASIFLIILISVVIEGLAIRREIGEMNTASKVAADGALVRFSNLEFASEDFYDDKDTLAYTSDVFDIKNNDVYDKYKEYLTVLKTQAENGGIYDKNSDIRAIVEQLQDSASNFRRGRDDEGNSVDFCYTPMQFGYSYLDKDMLKSIFQEDLASIVLANYHQDTSAGTNMYELAFTGMDRVRLDGVDVVVDGPKLIYEKSDAGGRVFSSLFGSSRAEALNMKGTHESALQEYDYVVAYDVKFIVKWKHETITPFFRNWAGTRQRISGNYLNENNQLEVQMNNIEFEKRYILTN